MAFSTLARILEYVWPPPPHLCFSFFFNFKEEISLCTLIPLFRLQSVNSGSASKDNCGWELPDELHVSSFPDTFPHYACGIVNPLWLHWVKCACVFRCNLPPAFLAEWLGSFPCHCSYMGVERTLSKSQHTKLTLEKKIVPPLLLRFKLATFCSRVQCSTNKRSWHFISGSFSLHQTSHLSASTYAHIGVNIEWDTISSSLGSSKV